MKNFKISYLIWGLIGLFLVINFKNIISFFQSLFSPLTLVGDVVSAPERLATALNKETDNAAKELVYSVLLDMAKNSNYDPGNADHVILKTQLDKANSVQARQILALWVIPKPWLFPGISNMTLNNAIKQVKQFLKRF